MEVCLFPTIEIKCENSTCWTTNPPLTRVPRAELWIVCLSAEPSVPITVLLLTSTAGHAFTAGCADSVLGRNEQGLPMSRHGMAQTASLVGPRKKPKDHHIKSSPSPTFSGIQHSRHQLEFPILQNMATQQNIIKVNMCSQPLSQLLCPSTCNLTGHKT